MNLGTVSTKLAEGELSQGLQLLKTNSKILTNILQTLIDLNYQIKVFSDETINSGGIEFINHQTHCQNHTLSAYLNDILKRQILQQATIASMVIDISLKPHKLNELQDQMRAQIETLTIANPENNAELGAKKAFETHLFLLLAQVITEMDKNTLSLENYLPLLYAASKNGYQNIPINEYQLKDKLKAKFKIDTNVKNTYEQIERNARSISFGDYSEIINFQQTLEKSLQEQNFAKEMLDTLAKGSTFNPCLNYLSQVTIINLFVRQGLAPQVVQTLLTLAQNFELAYLLHFKLIDKDGSIKDDTNRYLFGLIRDDKELHPRRLDSYWLLSLKIIYQLFLLLNAIVENQSPADTLIKNLTSFAKQLIEPTKQRTLLMAFQQALECLKNLNDVAQLKQPPIQTKLRALKKSQQSEIINSINQLCVPQLDFALLYQQISGIFKDEGTTGKSMLIFKMHIEKIICYTSLTSLQAKINQLLLKEKLAR